jgi:[acyl-carrier-protein] S-malonyltransferase
MSTPRIAFVFPGQGSHRPDMASAWLPGAADLLDELSDATGLDLVAVADDADECGSSTRLGQPAIHAMSLVALAALLEAGVTPHLVAGHSLGELTAAVAAGVFTSAEGAGLVAARGRAMGHACRTTPGAMAAVIRVELDEVERIIDTIDDAVIANINAPGQVVIAGTPDAVELAAEQLRVAGGRVLSLPVEGAFHSPAMTPAVVALCTALGWVPARDPQIPVVSGIDGALRVTAADIVNALIDGVLAPVRWVDVQQALVDGGADLIIEVGPGAVLTGLAKRTIPGVEIISVATPADVPLAVAAVAAVTARLSDRTPVPA